MASEITVSASLSVYKPSVMSSAAARSVASKVASMSGNFTIESNISVAITATLIPLGQVTAPHWAWFYNSDSVNFVRIRNGVSGADLIKLLAGEFALVPLYDAAVPYAIADTSPVILEYLIASL